MLLPTSSYVYVWRMPKEAYNPEFPVPTVKHGSRGVISWAAISLYSAGTIITLECSNFCQLLCAHFRQTGASYGPDVVSYG